VLGFAQPFVDQIADQLVAEYEMAIHDQPPSWADTRRFAAPAQRRAGIQLSFGFGRLKTERLLGWNTKK